MNNKHNYEDYEEEHYQIYNIIDRLRDECIEQYGSLWKASKVFGTVHLNKFLSRTATHIGMKMLLRVCKFLNVSLQYACFGGRKDKYVDQNVTLNNFYREYKEYYKGRCDHNVYVIWWSFKTGRRSAMSLKYLLKLAKRTGKTIDYLIGG